MHALNPMFRARPLISIPSLLLVPLFAYANFLCAAGGADDKGCGHEEAHSYLAGPHDHNSGEAEASHQQTPHHHDHDCSRDSCFCATMNTVVAQQTVAKPNQVISLRGLDFPVAQGPGVVPILAAAAYERGPPAIAPPTYLTSKIVSPRAPPRAV